MGHLINRDCQSVQGVDGAGGQWQGTIVTSIIFRPFATSNGIDWGFYINICRSSYIKNRRGIMRDLL